MARKIRDAGPIPPPVQIKLPPLPKNYENDFKLMQNWLFQLTPVLIQGLVDNLQFATGNERVRVLKELVDVSLNAKPYAVAPKLDESNSNPSNPLQMLFDRLPKAHTEEEELNIINEQNIP